MLPHRFRNAILCADPRAYRVGADDPALRLETLDSLIVDYAPFDHVERDAELVLVGLTPGRVQAANAIHGMATALRAGNSLEDALASAKRRASFSGPMRANLLALLDAIRVPALFGRSRAAEFFDADTRVHFTSALRYPVYVEGRNYSGSPNPLRHPILAGMIERYLAQEAAQIKNAIWVPLGGHAEAVLLHLSRQGQLDRTRILAGLPHPSGANSERIAYFLGRKSREMLSAKTNAAALDGARARLEAQIQERLACR
jgi:uracil-DNA glycosylase